MENTQKLVNTRPGEGNTSDITIDPNMHPARSFCSVFLLYFRDEYEAVLGFGFRKSLWWQQVVAV